MRPTLRIVWIVIVVVAISGAAALLVRDIHSGTTNCGSGLLTRDPSAAIPQTGDPGRDDYELQAVLDRCDRLILRQRYLAVLLIATSVVAGSLARRSRAVEERFPGDPIV